MEHVVTYKTIFSLAFAGLITVWASAMPAYAEPSSSAVTVHPFGSIGLTGGGDKLADLYLADGGRVRIRAGGMVDIKAGLELRWTQPVSVQFSLGYHTDGEKAENGSYRFHRLPLEVLGHFRLNDRFRLGGGLRSALDAGVSASGVLADGHINFRSTLGTVAEAEYFPSPEVGVKLRAVTEKYKGKGANSNLSVDGSHFGIYGTMYFR
jgi:hypothetical protein